MSEDLTHIRTDTSHVDDWKGLCGVWRPSSSVSQQMIHMIRHNQTPPFGSAVKICPNCMLVLLESIAQ